MISIVNYGLGNIKAFTNIYKNLNIPHKIVSRSEDLRETDKIIIPGVGAFDHAMKSLNNSGMREKLDKMVLEDKIPVIGICVGMQMLARSSEEGNEKGLGWIDGIVKKFDPSKLSRKEPLPHMGWNNMIIKKECKLLENLGNDPRFYFLHSYYFECEKEKNILAAAKYGEEFACVINSYNIYGIQCHPEKSHSFGIQLLKNFGEM